MQSDGRFMRTKQPVFHFSEGKRRKTGCYFSGKTGFQSDFKLPVFRKYETKTKFLCPPQVRQKPREALWQNVPGLSGNSHSMMATGFSLKSHRTRLTPSTVKMAWGFIGLLSRPGYIPAFVFAGVPADGATEMMQDRDRLITRTDNMPAPHLKRHRSMKGFAPFRRELLSDDRICPVSVSCQHYQAV